jgi:hypothetical protein
MGKIQELSTEAGSVAQEQLLQPEYYEQVHRACNSLLLMLFGDIKIVIDIIERSGTCSLLLRQK